MRSRGEEVMVMVASIEETIDFWTSSLREAKERMRPLFSQDRVAVSAGLSSDGLLGKEPRKGRFDEKGACLQDHGPPLIC